MWLYGINTESRWLCRSSLPSVSKSIHILSTPASWAICATLGLFVIYYFPTIAPVFLIDLYSYFGSQQLSAHNSLNFSLGVYIPNVCCGISLSSRAIRVTYHCGRFMKSVSPSSISRIKELVLLQLPFPQGQCRWQKYTFILICLANSSCSAIFFYRSQVMLFTKSGFNVLSRFSMLFMTSEAI